MPSPTAPNRHRILRQVLELNLNPGVRSSEFQEAVARSFWERTVPELEAVFDRVAGPDEILRLDRLEIDLGSIEGADWEPQFRRRLVEQVARRLAQFSPVSQTGGGVPERGQSQGSEPLRQFLFFLAHGRLPWWGSKPETGWPDTVLPNFDEADWAELRQLLNVNPHARLRLIGCVSDGFLAAAAEAFADLREIPRVLAHLAPAGLSAPSIRQWRREFWIILLDWALADGFYSARGVELARDLLRLRDRFGGPVRKGGGQRSHDEAPDRPDGTDDLPPLPQPWREWLETAREQQERPGAEPTPPFSPHNLPKEAEGSSAVDIQTQASSPRQGIKDGDPTPPLRKDEAIYLEGAGAVILHPFLGELFRGRGLLAERDFRDGSARHRAVRLLGLLGFGREDVPEYELLLPKLLSGLPFEEPLAPVELDDDDHAACDTLLRAVLRHWAALRSNSPDWLRAQFFLREGKLELVDFGWRLTVERRAQDVLLARLPWGLGVISLPWMAGRIYVRWLD